MKHDITTFTREDWRSLEIAAKHFIQLFEMLVQASGEAESVYAAAPVKPEVFHSYDELKQNQDEYAAWQPAADHCSARLDRIERLAVRARARVRDILPFGMTVEFEGFRFVKYAVADQLQVQLKIMDADDGNVTLPND